VKGNWAWNGQFRMLVCSSTSSSCLTTFTNSGDLACCENAASMVYDHRKIGFYTDGVTTVGFVWTGRQTLVTVRSGERAQDLKLSNAAQEFNSGGS
jgi:hypothetical protein